MQVKVYSIAKERAAHSFYLFTGLFVYILVPPL